MNGLPPNVQQYIRILLYTIFGALTSNGVQITDSTKNTVIGLVGIVATLAWTIYGTRLNGLLEMVKAKTGVENVEIKVNPDLIKPADVTQNTSMGIAAKASVVLLAVMLVIPLVACTQADVRANEDKALAIVNAIKRDARMAASVVKEAIDAVCTNGSAVTAGAVVIRTGLQTQSGRNTSQNLDNLDTSLRVLNDVCNRAAANPNDPAIKSLLLTAWAAYQSAKASQNRAIATGG